VLYILLANVDKVMFLAVIAIGALVFIYQSIVIVGGSEIAVLERRWFGSKMPQGRVIARNDEVGIQARTLGPGMHFLIPFIYTSKKFPFMEIKENEVGLVESIDGSPVPAGAIFAKVVVGHVAFQDGEKFLDNGGEKGPQISILPPGRFRINPALFRVVKANAVIVGKGGVGVVTAQDGRPIDPGRLLAKSVEGHNSFQDGEKFLKSGGQKGPQIDFLLPGTYRINLHFFNVTIDTAAIVEPGKVGIVTALDGKPLPESEYVAKSIEGHSDFQDASTFILKDGQRGPQLDVLKPGTYYINPYLFQVNFDDVAVVERGQVGVIVSNVGKEPTPEMQQRLGSTQLGATVEQGKEKYVVPKGFRGIQEEVAGPGRYYLNRMAFMSYIVDTTNITIDWDEAKETRFDSLKVVSKDGFSIGVSVKVVIRVRPDQAPYMVAKVGSVDSLINHVIHPMIDSSFRNQASTTSAMNFLQDRQEEQKKAEDRARAELEKYHVECVSVLICQIMLPQELMDTQTKKIIAQQQTTQYVEQQKAEETRIEMEKTKATADQQSELVRSEIAVKVADQKKRETITLAQGDAEAVKLKGEAEGKKIEAIGTATAEAYEKQKTAIGATSITVIEALKQIAAGRIKVMPDILTVGGNAESGLASVLTKVLALNLIPPSGLSDSSGTSGKPSMPGAVKASADRK